jgi:hypothetical protein
VNSNETNLIEFNGPDYNNDLPGAKNQVIKAINKKEVEKVEVKEKVVTKKFISPTEAKKIQKSTPAPVQQVE